MNDEFPGFLVDDLLKAISDDMTAAWAAGAEATAEGRSEAVRSAQHRASVCAAHRHIVLHYARLIEDGSPGDAEWVLRAIASVYAGAEAAPGSVS